MLRLLFTLVLIGACSSWLQAAPPSIEELQQRDFVDDYYSNVLYGYRLITQTDTAAARYVGNRLRCTNCHLNAGTTPDAIPLNVAGLYPKWRQKNGRRNDITLRIRECFLYSLDGIMPPDDAPEVLAIAAYISYLSEGEVIGTPPKGRGLPVLPDTGFDPNPANGKVVYQEQCTVCHADDGQGNPGIPPVWGPDSYNAGAGMNRIPKAAGFIWANMPLGQGKTLSHQEAWDVAAYLNLKMRPADPRQSKLLKFLEDTTTVPQFIKEIIKPSHD